MSGGDKARCERFGRDLNELFPVKFLGDLEMYAGIRFTRDPVSGNLTLSSQNAFFRGESRSEVWCHVQQGHAHGCWLDACLDEEIDVTLFRSLIGLVMWLTHQTSPDILNAVRALPCTLLQCSHHATLGGRLACHSCVDICSWDD